MMITKQQTEDIDAIIKELDYWAYCTWQGMKIHCPEEQKRLLRFFKKYNIHPYDRE